jgi:hypothetical protein
VKSHRWSLGASPLRGVGLSCCASSRCASRPCRASIPRANSHAAVGGYSVQAGCAGGHHDGGPSRGRGSQALVSVAGTRPTVPLDELARCSRTALRSTALRFASCAAHVPDRRPAHSPCPQPGRLNAKRARIGSTAAPVAAMRQLGGTSVAGTPTPRDHGRAARGSRRASAAVTPSAVARALFVLRSLPVVPVDPTAIPPTAPPS